MVILTGLVTLLVPVGLVALIVRPFGPVSRARVERFARRQSLVITPDNGPRVIDYLATTRRWRSCGILIALAISLVRSSISGRPFSLSALTIFAGWFAGAVVAEWRLGRGDRDGVRRAASLVPRRVGDYLSLRAVVVAAVGLSGSVAAELIFVVLGRGERLLLTLWLLAGLAVTAGIVLVARQVLTRPQPLADAAVDVELADQALRSRSLHVLLGSTLALAGYVLSVAAGIAARDDLWSEAPWPASVIPCGIILLPAVGVLLATASFVTRPNRSVRHAVL